MKQKGMNERKRERELDAPISYKTTHDEERRTTKYIEKTHAKQNKRLFLL
jgi:hypothetical protein|tara:strand:+ start:85 stop:234 length:150 start_codon:yes stop_codon:yes gene_type:complete